MVTMITALTIQQHGDDEIRTCAGQDKKTKKWAGFINLYHGDDYHTLLISSDPIFDLESLAIDAMTKLIQEIRGVDLAAKCAEA